MSRRSNNAPGVLVPRYVDQYDANDWHICMARRTFKEGAVVTLEALCGAWCYGTLSRAGRGVLLHTHPNASLCAACEAHFQARRAELDPHNQFRWRATNPR